jgi:hypothetical protein
MRLGYFLAMPRYFFDFRSGDTVLPDDDGLDLPDVDAAHGEAIGALADGLRDVIMIGAKNQHFAIEVRDDIGPVFEVAAVLGTKILRRQ